MNAYQKLYAGATAAAHAHFAAASEAEKSPVVPKPKKDGATQSALIGEFSKQGHEVQDFDLWTRVYESAHGNLRALESQKLPSEIAAEHAKTVSESENK